MKTILGMLAVAGLLAVAVPHGAAQAASLANPAAAATTRTASEGLGMTTEVRWHHGHGHWRGHHWRRHHWHRHHWRHRHWHHRHHRHW